MEIIRFLNGESEVQKGDVTSSRSCFQLGPEPELDLRGPRIMMRTFVTRWYKEDLIARKKEKRDERGSRKDNRV